MLVKSFEQGCKLANSPLGRIWIEPYRRRTVPEYRKAEGPRDPSGVEQIW